MKHNICFEINRGAEAGKKHTNPISIDSSEKEKSSSSFTIGQQITGTVVSAGEKITLNFGGQEITTSKEMLKNAVPGELRIFEIIKATSNIIELKPIEKTTDMNQQSSSAIMRLDKDQDTFMTQKEHTGKQAEKEKEVHEKVSKMEEIISKLSDRDYQLLKEEGFPVEELTVEGLHAALRRVKSNGSDNSLKQTNSSESLMKSAYSEGDITNLLEVNHLSSSKETVQKVATALNMSDTASKINDRTEKYLIENELEPTIENIYKAYYSGNDPKNENTQKLSPKAWKDLQPQVEEVIDAAGFEVNNENLNDAKWLIENNLPLTKQNFIYKKELEDIKAVTEKDLVMDKILEGIENGTAPKDVNLRTELEYSGEQVIADINAIRDESIVRAVENNTELTIRKIKNLQDKYASDTAVKAGMEKEAEVVKEEAVLAKKAVELTKEEAELTKEAAELKKTTASTVSLEAIKAQRQMEEIRLKMTTEVAARLEMKGFHIETERLEKVVEALKDMEKNYYKGLLSEADVEASDQQIQILKETTQSIEQLKNMPNSILGITLSDRAKQTIPNLIKEGNKLQAEMAKAGDAYEALMTMPNREYGDSIQKAFKNTESLLSEMQIENTSLNQRAVRILGYNSMEISKESIDQVKAYDLEVTTMIQNLHPAVTVRMIKEGINPLDMPIHELNETIDKIKEEQGISSEEKYSTYLRKLEKENSISGEERKAYIGIYRLLHNVENTDGAALGSVLKADREVTLNHLLTAVRTINKGSMDTVINDDFGTLESISYARETITGQLNSAFGAEAGNPGNMQQKMETDPIREQTEYLERMLKIIKDEISPDKLKDVQQELSKTAFQEGQVAAEFSPQLSSEKGIWDTTKNIPIEKLFDQLRKAEGKPASEEEIAAEKVQEIREIYKKSDQSVRFLNEFKLPGTATNIMMANHIFSNGDTEIKKLLKLKDEKEVENSENSIKNIDEIADTLIDKSSMNEAFEKLEKDARAALSQAYAGEIIDSKRLAELKNITTQMTFLKTLAGKEFYRIPIETESGITNINLTIIRGSEAAGKVTVSLQSELLGNVKADLSLKDQTLNGFISSDSRSGLEELKRNAQGIGQAAEEDGITIKQLDFVMQRKGNETYNYQNPENEEKGALTKSDTEKKLYRLAKAMVLSVRAAENSASGGKGIAS